jgi:NAD-dependent deacetylase
MQINITALTGAGISAESGVPTFRGAAGLWKKYRPEELATPAAFQRDPTLVWEFYAWRRKLVKGCEPNQAHLTLVKISEKVASTSVITQNVDGLHQRAGNEDVIELHGSLWKLKCTQCDHHWQSSEVPLPNLPPVCPVCGELARPDVVWFGEALDPQKLQIAHSAVVRSDVLLVIGTSALVFPAASLPQLAKENGATIVEINPQETPLSPIADQIFRQPATSGLKQWWFEFSQRG